MTGLDLDVIYSVRSDVLHVLVQLLAIMEAVPTSKQTLPASEPSSI